MTRGAPFHLRLGFTSKHFLILWKTSLVTPADKVSRGYVFVRSLRKLGPLDLV